MNIGFVGWRGMVGSELMRRMCAEEDFSLLPDQTFFSTSQVGQKGPFDQILEDAYSLTALKKCHIIVTCQGGGWTSKIYPEIRKEGWSGIWIDTASTLRMKKDSIIVLDPLNRQIIEDGLKKGIKTFVGGNCTVSLMLMACHGLFQNDLVEWMNSMTYQAASGAGAKNMQELISQMKFLLETADPAQAALELDKAVSVRFWDPLFPRENFGIPLALSLIPWIDRSVEAGQTREEWKGFAEANKILNSKEPIPIDGLCVRVGSMRCHSQAMLIKLKKNVPLPELEAIISEANEWVRVIPNEEEVTKKELTPVAVSGKLDIVIGRLHKARMGPEYLQAFTVGDQLLWGAAEPIRRTLRIILEANQ